MKITWYGHACFMVEAEGSSVVLDPYSPGSVPGVELPELTADAVICSHQHGDHGYVQGVKLTGRTPAMTLREVHSFHDDVGGAKRGENRITVLEGDGLRAVHLGDLGHMLSQEQIAALGPVDVLMIPVGGFFTIDAKTAWEVAEKITPRIIVPMHYRGEGFGFEVIGPVEEFLALTKNVRYLDSNVLEVEKTGEPMTAVLKCPVK